MKIKNLNLAHKGSQGTKLKLQGLKQAYMTNEAFLDCEGLERGLRFTQGQRSERPRKGAFITSALLCLGGRQCDLGGTGKKTREEDYLTAIDVFDVPKDNAESVIRELLPPFEHHRIILFKL